MKPVSVKTRFGFYILGHMGLSLVWAVVLWAGPTMYGNIFEKTFEIAWYHVFLTLLSLFSYLPVGWLIARKWGWTRPEGKLSVRMILYPAMIFWLWVWLALGVEVLGSLSNWLVVLMLPFASPAASFGILCIATGGLGRLPFGVVVFIAGLLPPLLFWLGSWLGASALPSQEAERAS